MLLARKGHRVLMLDRSRFPSDIPHGHLIHQDGPARLKRWGLLERIEASGCPRLDSVLTDVADLPLESSDLAIDGLGFAYAPRRKVLDQILIEAAVSAGAEFREACTVENLLLDGDRIVGVRVRDANGHMFMERATVTVGADGRNSRVARLVQAAKYEDVPTLSCYAFAYFSGVEYTGLRMYAWPKRAIFSFPTNGGLFAVFTAAPIAEAPQMSANLEAHFMATVDEVPELSQRLRAGRREERFYGAADLPNFYRKPYGPGWALVGDAGCHKDPYLALGVHDALRDADYLAEALDAALSGREWFDVAMPRYEQRRNEASKRAYQDNLQAAQLKPPPPEVLAIRAALRDKPEERRRFFMAHFGLLPRESFFNPENLQRLVREALS
jgi:2-polyprenyl-6-methoxyphenol hydroxylase-like FAD-dependent oxidoreductase